MNMKNTIVLVLIVAILLVSAGCYGSFNLTRSLHDWNGRLDGEWTSEGVFLLLVIIPVYGLTMLVDAVVLNSIEFWSGDNPVGETSMIEAGEDRAVELTRIEAGREQRVRVRLFEGEEVVDECYLVADGSGAASRQDGDGRILARAEAQADGSILVRDAGTGDETRCSRDDLARRFGR